MGKSPGFKLLTAKPLHHGYVASYILVCEFGREAVDKAIFERSNGVIPVLLAGG